MRTDDEAARDRPLVLASAILALAIRAPVPIVPGGVGFNVGYQRFDFEEAIAGATTGESSILSGVAGMRIDLFQAGPLKPYVTGGLGAFRIRDEFDATTGSPVAGEFTTSTRFGIDGGAGFALRIGRLEAFIEGHVQNVYTDEGVIDAKSIRAVPVTFGILF